MRTHDYVRDEEGICVREPVVISCWCGTDSVRAHAVVGAFFDLCKEGIALVSLEITREHAKMFFLLDDNEDAEMQSVRVRTRITNYVLDRVREARPET